MSNDPELRVHLVIVLATVGPPLSASGQSKVFHGEVGAVSVDLIEKASEIID